MDVGLSRRILRRDDGSRPLERETAWLLPVLAPVLGSGAVVLAASVWFFLASEPDAAGLVGLAFLLGAAVFAEAYPVPIEGIPIGATSLASIFIVGTAVIHGWAAAVIVACLTMALVEALHRRPPAVRSLYNTALYTLAAAAAGAAAALVQDAGVTAMIVAAVLGSTAFYVMDLALLALVLARTERERLPDLVRRCVARTLIPFLIMASLTLILVVLWAQSPYLTGMLVGPLVAVALYQRSVHAALEALRLARTDALTGLGNARGFNEHLDRALTEAEERERPLSVCLFDLDGFKAVNDRLGHAVGDRVLVDVASELRGGGEAYRLGGDEFALILPDCAEDRAAEVAAAIVERVAYARLDGVAVTVSAGIAAFPRHAVAAGELVRLADGALYRAKDAGKNCVAISEPGAAEMNELRRLTDRTDRDARLRAAASLAAAVDARDAYTGRHSFAVGELSARIAARIGLDAETVELTRLAGRLHDLGKLGIPTEVLRKEEALTEEERRLLEGHTELGFQMLESLGVEPVASWVLHHHERWDGQGYPEGLVAERIPLPSRIIFTADAYDAMTSDRVYRRGIPPEEALAELERCAGGQFDPTVVAALAEEVSLVDARVTGSGV